MKNLFVCLLVALMSQTVAFAQNENKKKAIDLSTSSTEYYINGDMNGAIKAISEAITLDPSHYEHYLSRAQYYSIIKKAPEAISDANVGITLLQSEIDNLKITDDFDLYRLNLYRQEMVLALFYRASMYIEIEDNMNALKDFSDMIDTYEKLQVSTTLLVVVEITEAYLKRGLIKHGYGNKKGALADFVKATEVSNGKSTDAFYKCGVVKEELGDLAGALSDYSKAIALGNASGSVYNYRGGVLHALGRLSEACADWRKASEMGEKRGLMNLEKYCK